MESLSHSIERAKKLVETFQKDYDCYIKCDMLEVFVLSNEIDKMTSSHALKGCSFHSQLFASQKAGFPNYSSIIQTVP